QEGLFILSRWGGFSIKTAIFSKNSKKDKHQNDVCLQSEAVFTAFFNESYLGGLHGNYSMVEL
uniref:hypothetical protein n=1 Tax=Streptococcus suis TaxID=1307 RepID=UPI001EE6A984